MIYAMKRTTVFLSDKIIRALKQLAARRGVSFAMVVREAASAYVAAPAAAGGVPSIAGKFASGKADTASRIDELLWQSPHG